MTRPWTLSTEDIIERLSDPKEHNRLYNDLLEYRKSLTKEHQVITQRLHNLNMICRIANEARARHRRTDLIITKLEELMTKRSKGNAGLCEQIDAFDLTIAIDNEHFEEIY